ncbi:MAG: DoxX family membrane protein [Actinobacteria bacterium]|nr:DoxX family membrane protein [Actinomycetota bacterium]
MKKYFPWFGLLARLTLGGVLITAGYLKAFNPSKAKMAVRAYEVLPIALANILGVLLPWVELGVGFLLILGVATRFTARFTALLMFVFIIAIGQAWARGLSIDCGCFGGGGQVDPSQTKYLPEIGRDIAFILISYFLIRYPTSRFALEKEDQ